jgi:hypothetical protein
MCLAELSSSVLLHCHLATLEEDPNWHDTQIWE